MFGLALIVFAIYFNNKQMNEFENGSNYHDYIEASNNANALSIRLDSNYAFFNGVFYKHPKILDDSSLLKKAIVRFYNDRDYGKRYVQINNSYDRLMESFANNGDFRNALLDFKTQVLTVTDSEFNRAQQKLNGYQKRLFSDKVNFYFLLITGVILFIPGLFLWYTKVQKPQDELLLIQLEDAKSKLPDNRRVTKTRRHFEPNVLPRPEARNMR